MLFTDELVPTATIKQLDEFIHSTFNQLRFAIENQFFKAGEIKSQSLLCPFIWPKNCVAQIK